MNICHVIKVISWCRNFFWGLEKVTLVLILVFETSKFCKSSAFQTKVVLETFQNMPSLVPPPSSSPGILRWASAAAAPSQKSWTDSRCCGAAGALVCQFLQIWKEPMQTSPLMGTIWSTSVNFTHCHRCLGFAIPTQDMTENLPSWVCRLASGFFDWSGSGRVYHGGFKATGLHLWRKDYTADLPAQAGDSAELLGHEGWERLGTDSSANRLEKMYHELDAPIGFETRHVTTVSFNIFEFRCAIPSSRPKRLSMESRMHPGTQWKWQVDQLEVVWRHGIRWFCFVVLCVYTCCFSTNLVKPWN